jgi:hypothetical protein
MRSELWAAIGAIAGGVLALYETPPVWLRIGAFVVIAVSAIAIVRTARGESAAEERVDEARHDTVIGEFKELRSLLAERDAMRLLPSTDLEAIIKLDDIITQKTARAISNVQIRLTDTGHVVQWDES